MQSLFVVVTALFAFSFFPTIVAGEKGNKMSSSAAMSKLTKLVKDNPVIVFSKTYCPYYYTI